MLHLFSVAKVEKMATKRKSNKRETKSSRVIDIDKAREERREKRALVESKKKKKTKPAREEISQRRASKLVRKKLVYFAIFLILLGVIGLSVFRLISLKVEEANAQAEYEALQKEKMALTAELKIVDRDEYIEQKAREELKMILPGERLYIISGGEKSEEKNEKQN